MSRRPPVKYYYLRNQGIVAPVSITTLRFRTADRVELILSSSQSFIGTANDLEIVDDSEILRILEALRSGIPYR